MAENDVPVTLPVNENFAAKDTWSLVIQRCPTTEFFIQRVTLPGMTIGQANQATPFNPMPHPGNQLQLDDLSVTFKLDANYANWIELHTWMVGITNYKNFSSYADYQPLGGKPFSDLTLNIQSNQRNPRINYYFRNAWPCSLQSIDLDFSSTDHEVNECTVSFKYSHFDIEVLSS